MEHGIRRFTMAQLHDVLSKAISRDAWCTMAMIRRELDRRAGRKREAA